MSVIEIDETAVDADLTEIARDAIWSAWSRRSKAKLNLTILRRYAEGEAGIPDVAEGANDELRALAKQSVINMCGVVVDTFDAGLSVTGFRSPSSSDDDEAWRLWQDNGMDARQTECHREVLTLGEAFVSVLPDDERDGQPSFAVWSKLDALVEFDDPRRDTFPRSAVLFRRVDDPELGRGWSLLLVDDTTVTPGFIPEKKRRASGAVEGIKAVDIVPMGAAWAHGATFKGRPVCPVVRFQNERPAEDRPPRGEVEPLKKAQQALNAVNFDRLVVSRFGAFAQKVIIGWTATADAVARMSSANALTFEDHPDDIRVQQLPGSPLSPYNELIGEIKEQIALQASIPLYTATGNLTNVSAETTAMVENAHQRKLERKRELLGESWETVLRLAVAMEGLPEPDVAAEMVWRETQARAFGAVVDGITKLAAIPPEQVGVLVELLDLIPGMTQQKIDAVRGAVTRQQGSGVMLDALRRLVPNADAV